MWNEIYHGILGRAKNGSGFVTTRTSTQITIETKQAIIVHRPAAKRMWCPTCAREVDIVELEEAKALIGVTRPIPRGDMGCQQCHVVKVVDGSVRICLDSVLRSM